MECDMTQRLKKEKMCLLKVFVLYTFQKSLPKSLLLISSQRLNNSKNTHKTYKKERKTQGPNTMKPLRGLFFSPPSLGFFASYPLGGSIKYKY